MTKWVRTMTSRVRAMTEWVRVKGFWDYQARRCLRVMAGQDTIQALASKWLKTRFPGGGQRCIRYR